MQVPARERQRFQCVQQRRHQCGRRIEQRVVVIVRHRAPRGFGFVHSPDVMARHNKSALMNDLMPVPGAHTEMPSWPGNSTAA